MKSGKGKKLALALMVVAIPVVIFALKDFAREEWYLYRLRHGDEAARDAAEECLVELGCFRAIPDLLEVALKREKKFLDSRKTLEAPLWGWALGPLKKLIREEAVPEILPILGAASAEKRAVAVWLLGILGPAHPSVLPGLARGLKDPDARVRAVAASVLGYFGPKAVPLLAGALQDQDAEVKRLSAEALLSHVRSSPEALEALKRCLGDPEIRVNVILRRTLAFRDWDLAREAEWLLLNLGEFVHPSWAPELKQAICSRTSPMVPPDLLMGNSMGNVETKEDLKTLSLEEKAACFRSHRASILRILRATGTSAVPHLLRALEKCNPDDKPYLAECLEAAVGPESEEAVPALASLAEELDGDGQYWALAAIAKIGPKAPAAAPALRKALGSFAADIRLKAARSLAFLAPGSREAAEDLEPLLEDESVEVRVWAACALGRMDIDRAGMISLLSKELSRWNVITRMEAAEALGLLDPKALQVLDELGEGKEDKDFRLELQLARKGALASLLDPGRAGQEVILAEIERLAAELSRMPGPPSREGSPGPSASRLEDALTILEPRMASWPPDLVPRLRDALLAALPRARAKWNELGWESTCWSLLERVGFGDVSARDLVSRWGTDKKLTPCQLAALGRATGGTEVLTNIIRSETESVRRCAAVTALEQAGASAVPILVELLKDPDQLVPDFAELTLANMGPDAREALEDLLEAWRQAEGDGGNAALLASWTVRQPRGREERQ